jgi:hypothetical protein
MRKHGILGYGLLMVVGLAWLAGQQGARPLSAQQTGGLPALERRVAALEAMNAGQAAEIAALRDRLDQAEVELAALDAGLLLVEAKTQDMGRLVDPFTGQPTVRFSGVNVQVVDGSGDTEGAVNGTGNLIVGYNESDEFSGRARNGSHNLIVGSHNDYASFGGIVAGRYNTVEGRYATITAGSFNIATGFGATVSGGDGNRATNTFSSVSGGFLNVASGDQSAVGGGQGVIQAGTFGWSAGSNGAAISGSFRSP